MKTGTIIKKNYKLLLRSRISTLVMIFGPLIVILLVGISFSTSSFNFSIGVYSEKYSELSNSFVDKLGNESYSVIKYNDETTCIENIKDGKVHACIVFPPDLDIEKGGSNVIKFHVDQSKVNIVYLMMSTLTSSFGERTTEISKGLTNDIITTLFNVKTDLLESESLITEISEKNVDIIAGTEFGFNHLSDLNLNERAFDAVSSASDISADLASLVTDTSELVTDAQDIVNDLDDYTVSNGSSSYQSDINSLEGLLDDINSTLGEKQLGAVEHLNKYIEAVSDKVENLMDKLDEAENTNAQVIEKLGNAKEKADEIKTKSAKLQNKLNKIVSNINSLPVTDAENIVTPIRTEINEIVQSQSNLGFLFPSLVVILIMFIGLLLPSTLVIMEKNSRAYFRTFTTPTKSSLFVITTYLTSILLVAFQVSIILLVSFFYFKLNLFNSFFAMIISLWLIMTFFIFCGMLIGYIFNTDEMAMLTAVSIGTLFLLTSGIIFPLESMPKYLLEKAKLNPVVLGSDMFKRTLLFDYGFSAIKQPFFYLFIFSIIIFGLMMLVRKAEKLQMILKKPSRAKMKKDYLLNLFDFGERKAENLAEFIVAIQNFSEDRYQALIKENVFCDWLKLVYKNKFLADKIEGVKLRKEIVDILVAEMKKEQEEENANKVVKK